MRIIFFGTPKFALPSLNKLIGSGFEVAAVVTTPDESMGRKGTLTPPPIKVLAKQNGLKIFQPSILKNDDFFEIFKNINPEVCIIVAYGKIIPKRYLEIPKFGFLNIHPSLLPKYRGPSPIQSALLNGDKKTGISLMKIDEGMDHGPILRTIEYDISEDKYCDDVEIEMADLGAELLVDTLPKYLNGKITLTGQDHQKATYVKKFERIDGRINWQTSARDIYNQIRGLNPNPGVWTTLNGKTLNIFKANIFNHASNEKIILEQDRLLIKTLNDYVCPTLLQLEGKKILPIKEFLNGFKENNIVIK